MKKFLSLFILALFTFLVQAQVSKTIDVPTAGTLSSLLTSTEKTTVTNLNLTGNIDAQDVKCLRDEMTVLAVLDLSGVSINAYNGNGGTVTSSTLYPANEMPQYSFYNNTTATPKTSLTTIFLPNSITSIGNLAFYYCSGLTGIVIPNSVTTIGGYAFQSCSGFTSITIGSGVTSIGDQAFYHCIGLKIINTLNPAPPTLGGLALGWTYISIVYVPTTAIAAYKAALGWSALPIAMDSRITINNPTAGGLASALTAAGYTQLSSISKLTVTGNLNSADIAQMKTNMTLLMEVDLSGATLTGNALPTSAFQGKTILTSVILPASLVYIGDNAFSSCTNLSGTVPLPSSLTSIGTSAFWNCSSLTGDLIIPNNVNSIGNYAFSGCTGLNGNLTLPNNITTIPIGAFAGCNGLKSILTIPQSVTSIESSAFYNCNKLTQLILGKNTASIGDEAFYSCTGLTKISVPRTSPPVIYANTFFSVNTTTCTLEIPSGSRAAYHAANYWSLFTLVVEKSDTYSITLQIGQGGSVQDNNVTLANNTVLTVNSGTTKTFTILPNTGYEIDTLIYSGNNVKSQIINNQYTTTAVTANTTLKVTFKKFFGIDVRIGDGGTVKENNVTLVNDQVLKVYTGDKKTFTITPDAGYDFDVVNYGGADIKPQIINNQYTTPAVSVNDTLNVTFIRTSATFGITINIGANGSVTENGNNIKNDSVLTVIKNATKTFTFTPDAGYEVATLTYGGANVKSQISNNQYTTQAIIADATLSVTFQKIQYRLSIKDASLGTTNLLCNYGATPSFEFIPSTNYKINTITYNGVDVTALLEDGVYKVPAVTGDGILNISFVSLTGAPQLIKSNVKVFTTQSDIVIDGTSEGETISLYTVNGTQIKTLKSQGERMVIPAQRDEIYLIRTDSKTFKVIL
jgi:hypothetical protein